MGGRGHNVSSWTKDHSDVDMTEAYYLYIMATSGIFLNLLIMLIIIARKSLRKITSAFIVHGNVLDIIKCAYCIPFGQSILTHKPPSYCELLGGSYVIVISSYVFNLVAMVCSEAFTFNDDPSEGITPKGNICCVMFGIVIVYTGAIILHLGPTIVGGSFDYNKVLSQCVFIYGETRSYVVYIMWVVVTTLSLFATCHYVWIYYKNIRTNAEIMLANAIRAASDPNQEPHLPPYKIKQLMEDAMSRARCYIGLIIVFVIQWYPLFICTLADPKFKFPDQIYRTLTLVAWSNGAINPVIFLCVDNTMNVVRAVICHFCGREQSARESHPLMSPSISTSLSNQMLERVGCRLCQEGKTHNKNLCNGRLDNGPLARENSFCELHTVSDQPKVSRI